MLYSYGVESFMSLANFPILLLVVGNVLMRIDFQRFRTAANRTKRDSAYFRKTKRRHVLFLSLDEAHYLVSCGQVRFENVGSRYEERFQTHLLTFDPRVPSVANSSSALKSKVVETVSFVLSSWSNFTKNSASAWRVSIFVGRVRD